VLLLFVTFPQLSLPEPKDCIFAIRSMMRFVDASFRRGWGSVVIRGVKRVYELSRAQERRPQFGLYFL